METSDQLRVPAALRQTECPQVLNE